MSDLSSTRYLDADSPAVQDFAARAVGGASDRHEMVRRLFVGVRDELRYDPYSLSMDPAGYVASAIAAQPGAYCVPKSILFVAACRAAGIPARVGFADVRNHLQSDRLRTVMGTDLFRYHGYGAVKLDDRWFKASPAFNKELCERFGVPPLDFDGTSDALLHAFSGDGSRYMEYVADHGTFEDVPLERLFQVLRETYPALTEARIADAAAADTAFA